MPEEEFKGVLAGGIRIKEVISEEEQTQSAEQGLGIRNAFSYVIGVVVATIGPQRIRDWNCLMFLPIK